MDYTQKGNLMIETRIDDGIDEVDNSDRSKPNFMTNRCEEDEDGLMETREIRYFLKLMV